MTGEDEFEGICDPIDVRDERSLGSYTGYSISPDKPSHVHCSLITLTKSGTDVMTMEFQGVNFTGTEFHGHCRVTKNTGTYYARGHYRHGHHEPLFAILKPDIQATTQVLKGILVTIDEKAGDPFATPILLVRRQPPFDHGPACLPFVEMLDSIRAHLGRSASDAGPAFLRSSIR